MPQFFATLASRTPILRVSLVEKYFMIGAVLAASVGAVTDVRSARIPNWLTYSSLLLALGVRGALSGLPGLGRGVVGVLVAGGFFFFLFLLGAMGGGDVKLMAAVGAWVGSELVVTMLIAAALAGGVLAVLYTLFGRRVRQTLWNLLELIRFRLTSGLQPHPVLNVGEASSVRVPFGVAIAMAAVYCTGQSVFWR